MKIIRNRLVFIFILVIAVAIVLFARLIQLQVIDAPELSKKARAQHIKKFPLPAERGMILDSEGAILALSTQVYTIWGSISDIAPSGDRVAAIPLINKIIDEISTIVDLNREDVLRQFSNKDNIVVKIKSDISQTEADLISSLVYNKGLPGISMETKNKRFYPYHNLASHIIGATNAMGDGFLGIEYFYNDQLSGSAGYELLTTDAHGKPLPYGYSRIVEAQDGHKIHLSLNNMIQFFVEEALLEAKQSTESKSASAVVMDIKENKVIAMASFPTFDLNSPYDIRGLDEQKWKSMTQEEKTNHLFSNVWKNGTVSDVFEPGSTFKTLISAIALEEGVIDDDTVFKCDGHTDVDGVELRCSIYPRGHGRQNLEQAFVNSCNVSYVQIVNAIGKDRLYYYLEKLGLLGGSGVDLPSEGNSIFIPAKTASRVDLSTMGYGHGISVNMINLANAMSGLVHDGSIGKPYVCNAIELEEGKLKIIKSEREQVFSEKTVARVRSLLEISANAPNSPFKINAVRLGGKSGTSVKFVDGEYDMKTVIASYIGFAPMEDPRYCVYVAIDEPKVAEYGMRVASPVVKRIIEDILRYNSVLGEHTEKPQTIVPDFVGLSLGEAQEKVKNLPIKLSTNPIKIDNLKRKIINQYPAKGTEVNEGFVIILNIGDE